MFLNIGPLEMMVILAIAILLIGPARVVQVVRSIGRIAGQLRSMSEEFTSSLQEELSELERAGGEARQAVESIATDAAGVSADATGAGEEAQQALESDVGERPEEAASVEDELKAIGWEARTVAEEITQGLGDLFRREQQAAGSQEGESDEAAEEQRG